MTKTLAPILPSRIDSLDGLRGLSILLVLVAHVATTQGAPAWLDHKVIHSIGNVGVRGFFVISGFLITSLLLRELDKYGRIDLRLFYIRRSLRILPAAYAYIFIIWACHILGILDLTQNLMSGSKDTNELRHLLYAITFTGNYNLDYNWYYNHLWSLSVEEQFYLLWPATLFFLGPRRALVFGIFVLAASPVFRTLMYFFGNYPEIALTRQFQAVADILAIGSVGAIVHNRLSTLAIYSNPMGSRILFLGLMMAAVGYGLAIFSRPVAYLVGQTVSNVGILLVIQFLIRKPDSLAGALLNSKPMVSLGILSYSLYLWQEPFLYFRGQSWTTEFPQNIVLTFVAAMISYKFIELPFLRIKSRYDAKLTVRKLL